MADSSQQKWFEGQLRTALIHLYNPQILRNSVLIRLFNLEEASNTVVALRATLTKGIESLRPAMSTPNDARSRRVYQILRRRFIEQVAQKEVADELGLSVRQLQREEKAARSELASFLWEQNSLEGQPVQQSTTAPDAPSPARQTATPTHSQELESLRGSVPLERVDIGVVLEKVLQTIAPLQISLDVTIGYAETNGIPTILARPPLLRQAFISLIGNVMRAVPGGRISLETAQHGQTLTVDIHGYDLAKHGGGGKGIESLEMTERLIQLCRGTLEHLPLHGEDERFAFKITFAMLAHITVLGIDDNADILRLYQRHLSGSPYRFVGAQNAADGLALANELTPQAIILDVMMPEHDGWTILSQLREQPNLVESIIIVCTILPQEMLAMTLGADQFIRKPVGRTTLLNTLNQYFDQLPKRSG